MRAIAKDLRAQPVVQQVTVVADARSLIISFAVQTPLDSILACLWRAAQGRDLSAAEPASRELTRRSAASGTALTAPFPPSEGSGAFPAALRKMQQTAVRKWNQSLQQKPDTPEKITAENMPPEKPRGLKGLVLPTVALTLAATEILPVAITGAALAAACIPIFQRAARGIRKRQLTVDEFDFANVLLLALEGSLLPASAVTWLIGLGEMIRGETVREAQRETIDAAYPTAAAPRDDARRLIRELLQETLSNTRSQTAAIQTAGTLTYPLAALSVAMAFLWREPAVFIDVFKPRNDFEAAVRFSIPTSLLNAITRAQRRGVHFGSGRAVESLAKADAFLIPSVSSRTPKAEFLSLIRALLHRGVGSIVLPPGSLSDTAVQRAGDWGPPERVRIQRPGELSLTALRAQGLGVALLSDTASPAEMPDISNAEVRLLLRHDTEAAPEAAEVVIANGWKDVPYSLDIARQAQQILAQNLAIAAGASTVNFVNGLLQVLPTPVPTLINTLMIAATAGNSRRLVKASRPSRQARAARQASTALQTA